MSDVIEIQLTKGYVAVIDKADEALAAFKWYAQENGNGRVYAFRNVRNPDGTRETLSLHRAVLGDACAGLPVDHIDGDGLNDRRANLRAVAAKVNSRNRAGAMRNSTSGVLGVRFDSSRQHWRASIKVDGRKMHLGYFDTMEEAGAARLDAEIKFWGVQPRRAAAHAEGGAS